MRQGLKSLIKLGLSACLAGYVFFFSGVSIRDVVNDISSADRIWIFAAASLHISGLAFSAYRWKVLLMAQDIHQPILKLFSYYMVGHFFNMFLPSAVGGDVMRIYDTSRDHGSAAEPFAVIIIERLSGLLTLLIIAGVILLLDVDIGIDLKDRIPGLNLAIGLFIAGICLLPTLLHPQVERFVMTGIRKVPFIRKQEPLAAKLFRAFRVYSGKPKFLLSAFGIGVLLQLNYIIHYFLIGRALGINVGFAFFFVLVPARAVALMIPFFINGIGIREFFDVTAFGLVGVESSTAIAFAELAWILQLAFALFGGMIYVSRRRAASIDTTTQNPSQ